MEKQDDPDDQHSIKLVKNYSNDAQTDLDLKPLEFKSNSI